MRVGFIRIHQKTNSFSTYPTTIEAFTGSGIYHGTKIESRFSGTESLAGALIDACSNNGTSLDLLLSMSAPAAGLLKPETLDQILSQVESTIDSSAELDGLIVELSGTMATLDGRSADAAILKRISNLASQTKVIAALDHQANLSREFTDVSDCVIARGPTGWMNEADFAAHLIEVVTAVSNDLTEIVTVIERIPILVPVAAQRHDKDPFPGIMSSIELLKNKYGLCDVSITSGFPFADLPAAGASAIATGPREQAEAATASLAGEFWEQRTRIYVDGSNIEEAVHHAMASQQQPVVIADLGDNPDDGAPGDGTTVLWALLDLGVQRATVAPICDEQAVEACVRAGVDSNVAIPVGGRKDTRHGYPIDIEGKVTSIHDGPVRLTGPVRSGMELNTGRIVVLTVDARHNGLVELILTEHPVQITDTSFFEHVGIDVADRKIVSIKSAGEYEAAFAPIASQIFEVITPGITTPDPAFFEYQHLRRPIFPIDVVAD